MKQRWYVIGEKLQCEWYTDGPMAVEVGDVVTVELSAPRKQKQTWLLRVDQVSAEIGVRLTAIDIVRVVRAEATIEN